MVESNMLSLFTLSTCEKEHIDSPTFLSLMLQPKDFGTAIITGGVFGNDGGLVNEPFAISKSILLRMSAMILLHIGNEKEIGMRKTKHWQ